LKRTKGHGESLKVLGSLVAASVASQERIQNRHFQRQGFLMSRSKQKQGNVTALLIDHCDGRYLEQEERRCLADFDVLEMEGRTKRGGGWGVVMVGGWWMVDGGRSDQKTKLRHQRDPLRHYRYDLGLRYVSNVQV
jgi:hypothetical protein